jgi:hypothetical protein
MKGATNRKITTKDKSIEMAREEGRVTIKEIMTTKSKRGDWKEVLRKMTMTKNG